MIYFKKAVPFIVIGLVIVVAYMIWNNNKKKTINLGGPPLPGSGIVPPSVSLTMDEAGNIIDATM